MKKALAEILHRRFRKRSFAAALPAAPDAAAADESTGRRTREARDAARPTQTAQPAQRSIRYDDPRSARAEEGLIRILYLDPGAAKGKTLPPPESFSSPVLARLYRELLRRVQTGETISMAVLAGQFTGDEMSHFTSVLGAPEDLSHADKAISDYIAVITGRTEDAEDDLRALAEKYRKTKSFGG